MTLRFRAFERRVRRRVRRLVSRDPALKAERRRMRRRDWNDSRIATRLVQIFACIAVGCSLSYMAVSGPGSDWLLVLLTLFATGQILILGGACGAGVPGEELTRQLRHYPVSDVDICRAVFRARIRQRTHSVVLYTVCYGAYFLSLETGPRAGALVGLSLGAAALLWMTVAALALIIASFVRHPAVGLLGLALALAAGIAAFAVRQMPGIIGESGTILILATPAGWVSLAMRELAAGRYGAMLLGLAPCVALLCASPLIFGLWFRRMTPLPDAELPVGDVLPGEEVVAPTQECAAVASAPAMPVEEAPEAMPGNGVPPAAAPSGLTPGALSAPADPLASGWIERTVGALLSERERRLAVSAFPDKPGWSARWRVTLIITIMAALLCLAPGAHGIACFIAVLATMCAVPVLGGAWPMMDAVPVAGGFIPRYAFYPVRLRSMGALVLKVNAVRIVVWTPVAVAFMAWATARAGEGAGNGAVIALKAMLVLLAAQPAVLACRLFMQTASVEHLTFRTALLTTGGFLVVLAGLGSAALLFFVGATRCCLIYGAIAAVSYGMWRAFLLVHHSPRTDLVRIQDPSS